MTSSLLLRTLIAGAALTLTACGPAGQENHSTQQEADVAIVDAEAAIATAEDAVAEADRLTAAPSDRDETEVEQASLSDADRGRVCRAAIASIMGRDPGIIRVTSQEGDLVEVGYTRDDGTRWAQVCRVHNQGRVEWAGIENGQQGRWRNEDSILFEIREGDAIHIRQSSMGELLDDQTYVVE